MRFRSSLILLLLAAGLGAYTYWIERPARERDAAKKTLLQFDREAVDAVTLTYQDREIRLEMDATSHWRLAAPIVADADKTVVRNLVGAIAEAEITKTIAGLDDFAPYGFDPPLVKVQVSLVDGEDPPAVSVGKETPIGFKTYVRIEGDANLYLTTGAFHSGMKKEVKDVRDKTVIDFADHDVQAITVAKPAWPAVVVRRGDEDHWQITEPKSYPADATQVRSFLSALKSARAQDFIDNATPSTLEQYGLQDAELRVTLSLGKDQAEKSILLGTEVSEDAKQIYSKRGESDTVYLVPDRLRKSLDKDINAFRDHTVLAFDPDAPTEITISSRDSPALTIVRKPDAPWRVKDASGKPKTAAIERFVGDLRQLKPPDIVSENAADFPAYGLDDPEIRIVVIGPKGNPIGTLLANRIPKGENDEEKFYFARESSPTIYEGRRYMWTRLEKSQSDFIEAAHDTAKPAS